MTEAIEGEGMDKPDEIVVTWFADANAREAFENDPDFKRVAEIRDRLRSSSVLAASQCLETDFAVSRTDACHCARYLPTFQGKER